MGILTELADPPGRVLEDSARLKTRLDESVPPKHLDRNLLVATWNIQKFGNLTKKWAAGAGDSPKRDYHALLLIREIVSRFDVVAVQEVMSNLRALRYMMKLLGPEWGFLMTDVNVGDKGNDERIAYVYDTRRVRPSGLACELVIPEEEEYIPANAFQRQFVRTPYAASFISKDKTFILTSCHIYYGEKSEDRAGELRAIARMMAGWARREKEWGHNYILTGDFNIDRMGDPLYDAFVGTGLYVPEDLHNLPRTIFAREGEPDTEKFYDQLAWFKDAADVPQLTLEYVRGGYVNFVGLVMRNLSRRSLGFRLSDHFPLWAEFRVDR